MDPLKYLKNYPTTNWNDCITLIANENIQLCGVCVYVVNAKDRMKLQGRFAWKLPGVNWVCKQIIDGLLVNQT